MFLIFPKIWPKLWVNNKTYPFLKDLGNGDPKLNNFRAFH